MANQRFSTETDELGRISGSITAVADALTTEFSTLMTDLEPVRSTYEGQGATSFQTVRENIDLQLGRLNVSLRSLAEAMGSAGTDYVVTDDDLRSSMEAVGASEQAINTAELFNPGGAR